MSYNYVRQCDIIQVITTDSGGGILGEVAASPLPTS